MLWSFRTRPLTRREFLFLGLIAGMILINAAGALGVLPGNLGRQDIPYDQVRLLDDIDMDGDDLSVSLLFHKLKCEPIVADWVGVRSGVPVFLPYATGGGGVLDLQSLPVGDYRIDFVVDARPADFDIIELRTRHACPTEAASDHFVDRIMVRVEPRYGRAFLDLDPRQVDHSISPFTD